MICPVTAGAVIYVTGLNLMRAFYQECFGLEITDSAGDYCVLRSGAWTLSLIAAPDAAAIQISVPSVRRDRTRSSSRSVSRTSRASGPWSPGWEASWTQAGPGSSASSSAATASTRKATSCSWSRPQAIPPRSPAMPRADHPEHQRADHARPTLPVTPRGFVVTQAR